MPADAEPFLRRLLVCLENLRRIAARWCCQRRTWPSTGESRAATIGQQ
jgi:hypothetical protein